MRDFRLNRRAVLALFPGAALAACTTEEQQAILGAVIGPQGTGTAGGLTAAEAAEGIRAALDQGTASAIAGVGVRNGYFADRQIRIPLPERLAVIQSQLAPFGLARTLDELEVEINRGAEQAAGAARPIFADAVRSMTINDAIGIVNGGPTSATDYFERRTTPALNRLFTPVMEEALARSGAIRTFDGLVAQLDDLPLAPQLGADAKADLVSHAVGGGLDGLFYYIAQEEREIRTDPARRTSEILRRVFG